MTTVLLKRSTTATAASRCCRTLLFARECVCSPRAEQGEVEKLQNDLRAAQRRVRELESSGVTTGGGDDGEMKISSLGLMDNEWQEREQNLLRQLEDERFRCSVAPSRPLYRSTAKAV